MTIGIILLAAFVVGKCRHWHEDRRETIREYVDQQHEMRTAGGRFANPEWYIPTIRNS